MLVMANASIAFIYFSSHWKQVLWRAKRYTDFEADFTGAQPNLPRAFNANQYRSAFP
jgi:hypothetical protein